MKRKPGTGRGNRTIKYAPPISIEADKEQIKAGLVHFIQNFQPGDRLKVKGLPGVSFMLCRATATYPVTPIPCVGYPYKRGKVFFKSPHHLKFYRENLNHSILDKVIEVFNELFPQFKDDDDPEKLSVEQKKYMQRGIVDDVLFGEPEKEEPFEIEKLEG